jgi:hypothetical protein
MRGIIVTLFFFLLLATGVAQQGIAAHRLVADASHDYELIGAPVGVENDERNFKVFASPGDSLRPRALVADHRFDRQTINSSQAGPAPFRRHRVLRI